MGVLLFHLNVTWVKGGFLGVDVFFVISGFLITTIIQRDILAGQFSLRSFYEKRIRRIIPALFFVLLASFIAAWFLLLPTDMLAFAKSLRSAVLSISNLHFLHNSQDYFSKDANAPPLLHTWSLGVEEQFYLFFPFLLIGLNTWLKSKARLLPVVGLLLLGSFFACFWQGKEGPMESFFLLPFRAWEMLLGAFLALLMPAPLSSGRSHFASLSGLALIVGSMLLIDETTLVPGLSAIPACAGACLLLYAGTNPASYANRLLAWRPIAFLGLISYSVYLWHWPLVVFAREIAPTGILTAGVILSLSLFAGWLSWLVIERPFRDRHFLTQSKVFLLWLTCTAVLLGTVEVVKMGNGLPGRYSPEVVHYLSFQKRNSAFPSNSLKQKPAAAPVYGSPSTAPTIALWGDSHAESLLPVLDSMAKEHHVSFKYFGLGGQPPILDVVMLDDNKHATRLAYTADALDCIISDKNLRTVVLHARWSSYNKGKNEQQHTGKFGFYGHAFTERSELETFYGAQIKLTLQRLLSAGKTVVLVYPVPEAGINVPEYLAKRLIKGGAITSTIRCHDFYARHEFILNLFDLLPSGGHLVRIKPHSKLLSGDQLFIIANNQPLYRDDDHLSEAGAFYIQDLLTPIFVSP